jgi:hypothetical protein
MGETTRLSDNDDTNPVIVDVSQVPLERLLGDDDSPLTQTIRSVLNDLGRPDENYAAHGTVP